MKKKTSKKKEFLKKIPSYPSLEQLLWVMNGMEKCKVFSKLEFDDEGRLTKAFTKRGSILYARLVDFIYGLYNLVTGGELSEDATSDITAEDMVETLDNIVRNEY